MNYNEYIDYLKESSNRGICLGLERISELMEKLDNPQNKTKIIHVSGTNGKGSFCAMLSAILKSAGYRTGNFSSPALTGITDNFRIDCEEISEKDFTEIMDIVYPACESMTDKPTEFEILTAVAFELFARKECDIAIVECGMGGDTDSTNVITAPLLSVITNVQKDHTAILGKTIDEIATHKAGIIKHGRPVFFGCVDIPEIIEKTAREKNSELFTVDYSGIKSCFPAPICSLSGTSFMYRGMKINLSLIGTHQLNNAVNVLNCIEILKNNGLEIPYSAIKSGLASVKWRGRFEILRKNPPVIFDGAHNPDGVKNISCTIEQCFGKKKLAFLIGVMADKDYDCYAHILRDHTEIVFTVSPDNPRSLDCQTLAGSFSANGIPACAFHELEYGVESAYSYAKEHDIPLIAMGSLYMYKDFINSLNKI
ncbi:MAG: bifunctional folylpolyglutamate synthase/dihydrofolate synthase [Prevotella sp.]|nr:bifunctional folylpolyglutamate synthase/dihydrofolate synthase [Alistipes senegalensis]MCM1357590.1 bifunctional folylpolyglutamate synthase/dihydrofolate synthase [Prevotella sp.]